MISNLESILSKSKALIVDDDEINREILGVYLDAHYSIYYASNGVEALELLKEHDDISVVLLDLLMPVMDDFGSGYSNLNMLTALPFDIINRYGIHPFLR